MTAAGPGPATFGATHRLPRLSSSISLSFTSLCSSNLSPSFFLNSPLSSSSSFYLPLYRRTRRLPARSDCEGLPPSLPVHPDLHPLTCSSVSRVFHLLPRALRLSGSKLRPTYEIHCWPKCVMPVQYPLCHFARGGHIFRDNRE